MDDLRKFINDNHDAFHDQVPPQDMWSRIDHQLGPQPIRTKWSVSHKFLAAASVVLLLGLGFISGGLVMKKNTEYDMSPEFVETESFFQRKIDAKIRAVAVHTTDSVWREDIQQLEVVMKELKEELRKNPQASKGDIIQAMINNYNIRLDIMDKILEKTNDKTYFNTKPSNNDSTE